MGCADNRRASNERRPIIQGNLEFVQNGEATEKGLMCFDNQNR
jgi:hypothetical protein